jgi:hypothetical protein
MEIKDLEKAVKEGKLEDKMPSSKKDLYVEGKKLVSPLMPGSKRKDLEIDTPEFKGKIVPMKKGGKVSSASKRADGIAQRGKTRGRVI